jgi:autotransporter-associated beta strand protein
VTTTLFGSLAFVAPAVDPVIGSLSGSTGISLTGLNSLTVGGNGASTTYTGALTGSIPGGLNKQGAGIWTLGGANTQTGPFNINAGTVLLNSNAALSPTASVLVQVGATLDLNGFDAAVSQSMLVAGNIRLGGGSLTSTASGGLNVFGGRISNGFLRAGPYGMSGGTLSGITTFASTAVTVSLFSASGTLSNFINGGTLSLVAPNGTNTARFDGFSNEGSGSVNLGATSVVNAADFQTYGTLSINPAAVTENFTQTTLMTNTGTTPLYFNGGSRTFVGTPATAVFPVGSPQAGQPTFVAGVDLNGKNAVVAGGLFVNNGYVEDSSNGFTGTGTVVADFGSLVKGAGFFQNSVQTVNGGKFQPGNSPGVASFGKFVLGPGGVDSYIFAIDDATGAAGPSPDAAGHVSGWGLVRVGAPPVIDRGLNTQGDFVWTATPADKLLVTLETLLNPTTVGVDVPGAMDHFDPTRTYVWPAVEWAGSYAGPADASTLDASTVFDTTGFVNDLAGRFGWSFDATGHALSLTYTPSAVPEPGSLALAALAAAGVAARRLRRRP